MSHGHTCAICGSDRAPWGYRLPGLRSDLPAGKRGYLWVCDDHRDEAERRRDAASGGVAVGAADRGAAAEKSAQEQGGFSF